MPSKKTERMIVALVSHEAWQAILILSLATRFMLASSGGLYHLLTDIVHSDTFWMLAFICFAVVVFATHFTSMATRVATHVSMLAFWAGIFGVFAEVNLKLQSTVFAGAFLIISAIQLAALVRKIGIEETSGRRTLV